MSTGDWSAIATAVMALATLFLACRTGSMAKATKNMVDETKAVSDATLKEAKAVEQQTQHIERQVKISSDALQSSVQPWLTWRHLVEEELATKSRLRSGWEKSFRPRFGLNISEDGDAIAGTIVVKNVGSGVAILDPKNSHLYRAKSSQKPDDGIQFSIKAPVVPPGEQVTIEFLIPGTKGLNGTKMPLVEFVSDGGSQTMWIEISYSDVLGARTTSAKFQAYRKCRNNDEWESWRVIKTTYQQEGRDPIVVTSI